MVAATSSPTPVPCRAEMKCTGAYGTKSSLSSSSRRISSRCSIGMPSHLLTAMMSARPRCSARPSTLASCSPMLSCASTTKITTCAVSIACNVLATLAFSTSSSILPRRRTPAVSIKVNSRSSRANGTKMLSRVVPGMSLAITRSSPIRRLTSVDLPTLGRPMMAMRMRPSFGEDSAAMTSGSKSSSTRDMSSRHPSPCAEAIASGSPSPKE